MTEKNLDTLDFNSRAFFSVAAVEDVKDRLASGHGPNDCEENGTTPLYWAASATKDPAVIVALLDAGGDARSRSKGGVTPLHWAAGGSDEPRVLELLIEAGADPNALSDRKVTPLHRAANRRPGNPKVIEVLADAGADPNVFDRYQYTPLHWAASNCEDPAVIEALIGGGADPNLQGVAGSTALQMTALAMAVSYNGIIWGEDGKTDIAEALIRGGADPNLADDYGNTAMHFATTGTSTLKVFELLVEAGADLTARDCKGKTPLQVMHRKKDKPQIVEYLKRVEAQQKSGPRPLLGERLAQVRKND